MFPGKHTLKRLLLLAVIISIIPVSACSSNDSADSSEESIYRQYMREFVQSISAYSKKINSDFIIIPQNGHDLLTEGGETDGTPAAEYIQAIDGVGREDLFYGYDSDNKSTPASAREEMTAFMDIAVENGVRVLATDYCWTQSLVDDSYTKNAEKGYISFAAEHRELDIIPAYPAQPYGVNTANVISLAAAKNFLYLLSPDSFDSKASFLDDVSKTNYDVLIIDLFYDEIPLTPSEISGLKTKANGGSRLVIAYMSIGEAEDYRYYWQEEWDDSPPDWLKEENPGWAGNYKVRYWDEDWQGIIYENDGSYLNRIMDAGFDGVYLDIIDAFEYFED